MRKKNPTVSVRSSAGSFEVQAATRAEAERVAERMRREHARLKVPAQIEVRRNPKGSSKMTTKTRTPRGYSIWNVDFDGYPRFGKGEQGKVGTLLVAFQCRAGIGYREPDRCGWQLAKFTDRGWQDVGGMEATPEMAAKNASKMRKVNPRLLSDSEVLTLFTERRAGESKNYSSTGQRLDISGMGGRNTVCWHEGKIVFPDTGSRSGQALQRKIARMVPKNWLLNGRGF